MSQLLLNEQATAPNTPAAGKHLLYADTGNVQLSRDEAGVVHGYTSNAAVAAQGAGFASDTWVTNSDLLIPSSVGALNLQAKGRFSWKISASKTAASTATPIYTIRIGSGRATTDTSILQLTGPAQTAVADIGTLNIMCTLRTVGTGTAAVLQGTAWWDHQGTAANTTTSGTGFANNTTGHIEGTSGGFDSSGKGGQYVSISINGGTSSAWTMTQVWAEAWW